MPVIAIGAAALAVGEAAGAIGAVISGGLGALTLTGALEITAALGATLGAVGVVTKDKSLQMAGLVMGGIGGVGALASSAGLFGAEASTASLFGDSTAAAADFPAAIDVTPQIAGSNISAARGASGASTGIVDSWCVRAGRSVDGVADSHDSRSHVARQALFPPFSLTCTRPATSPRGTSSAPAANPEL